jgi:hypothetical protein
MEKRFGLFLLTFVVFGVAFSGGRARADARRMKELVPDAVRARKAARTYVFSRAQFKYGLERDDYLSRWIDQPLFVDPTLRGDATERQSIYYPSFRKIQEVVAEYGLDGLGFFPETSGRAEAYELARRSGLNGFHLLTEFTPGDLKPSAATPSKMEVLKMALANPASMRLDGKVVVVSYVADSKPLSYWKKTLGELHKQYGDRFIFLPAVYRFAGQSPAHWQEKFYANSITPADIEAIKAYLREWARATDGLYYNYVIGLRTPERTFDPVFYREFAVRLLKSVLAEPEFKDKYFALAAAVGHENVTRVGYTTSSDGTKTLRHSFEASMDAQPDLIDIPEWDEENENTSLRPTVYNGTSSMRIMRYYTSKLRHTDLTPLPGDDTSVPNLIISYRKLLTLGEKLHIELLNVPATDKGSAYTVQLTLEDLDGKTVYTSDAQQFHDNELTDHTLTLRSETLAAYEVLRPRLAIKTDQRTITIEDGLHYIELRPTWNWDYKWVKQPLRDLMRPTKVDFQVGPAGADGKQMVSATFEANEPLAYVEVLDNDDIVYIQPPAKDAQGDGWRENADQVILDINWQSRDSLAKGMKLGGTIALKNAPARWRLPGDSTSTARDPFSGSPSPALKGQTLSLAGMKASNWRGDIFLAIPRSQVDKAVLAIDMPGLYEGELPVKRIIADSVYGIPGPNGFNMVIGRYLRQDRMPRHLGANGTTFQAAVLPDLPNSVLHLQAIGVSGHLYRSKPVLARAPSGKQETVAVYSETQKRPVSLEVASSRVPDIRYEFDPRHGSAVVAEAGRPFWGILGGYFTQVTQRGGGASNDGSPFLRPQFYPAGVTKGAPDWVKTENGEYALQFDGKGTYVTLPQGVIPRRAGYTISMDIKPDTTAGRQLLIGNRTYYFGSLVVYLDNGKLTADFLNETAGSEKGIKSDVELAAGKWSHLVIRYDQKSLVFSVDGKAGAPLAVEGPGLFDTLSEVGGFGKDWFKGQIKNLRIHHSPAAAD